MITLGLIFPRTERVEASKANAVPTNNVLRIMERFHVDWVRDEADRPAKNKQ